MLCKLHLSAENTIYIGAVTFLPEEKGTLGGRIVSGAGIVVECIRLNEP
jgi:hypothetical protein